MGFGDSIKQFKESDNFWASLARDIISIFAIVATFAILSQIMFGLWTPMVAVESSSMEPHMNIGDIIFIQSINRTEVITHDTAPDDYVSFGMGGDVILYRPYGQKGVTPVIHRAMYLVEKGEPMWENGPIAPYTGYITKGDNPNTNKYFDQQGMVSYLTPVKKEWIIGVARYRIPYLGYIRLLF
jgi:signal peptidase